MTSRLPSDALTKRTSPIKVAIIAVAAVVLVGGLGTAAFAIGPSLRAGLNHPTATATVAPADTLPTLSPSELDSVQQAADAQQTQIAADQAAAAKAAADAAAAQSAAAAKAAAAHTKCPAGSMANSGNNGIDLTCFPDICFHITLPDPAHPECVTAFKP